MTLPDLSTVAGPRTITFPAGNIHTSVVDAVMYYPLGYYQ